MATFSPRVMRLLSTELTDTPLRQIDALFDDHGIQLGPPQPSERDESVRRERMRRYLSTLDLETAPDAGKLAAVLSELLQQIVGETTDAESMDSARRDKWVRILRADGFDVNEATGEVRVARLAGAALTEHALNALEDPDAILDHLRRLGDSVDSDPRLAISTAKALIESTAKCVLTARNQTYTRAAKVPALVNAAQESLGLAAKSVSDEDRAPAPSAAIAGHPHTERDRDQESGWRRPWR
ncbi:hypothetical protein [Janibacter sp. YB324]|uniref:hypothetical protein n=1 Tax=Janibacter sp. YB324 TaxID=2761047 RepID=UPI001629FDD5|nr:hypothetical protein [Janibacter sp. YB324]QNF95569.1 hypothetical protein H7A72_07500 [Janibacter sp. YB324]